MVKNKQSNLIASVKMLNISVIDKYTINKGIGEGGYSVLVNYQSFLSNLFSLAPPPPPPPPLNYFSLQTVYEIDYSVRVLLKYSIL